MLFSRMILAAAAGAALCLAPAGCAQHTTVTTRTVLPSSPSSATWMGRSVEEVERIWGEAPERESDGEGGVVLVYRTDTGVSVSAGGSSAPGPTGAAGDPERTQSEKITKVRARFWINPAGNVYRYWFSQDVYDAGKDAPPAPEQP
jgi:hypothetical protein